MTHTMLGLFAIALLALAAPLPTDLCLHTVDRDTCNSRACPGYSWCELCHACRYDEDAVTLKKDEL